MIMRNAMMTMQKLKCMTLNEAHFLIFRCFMAAPMRDECLMMEESGGDVDMGGVFGDDYGDEEE
jgi:hypothetical protein